MLPGLALLAASISLASLVGFAAARGGICAVRAIEDILDDRGGTLFLGFLKCSAWAAAATLPLAWAMAPGARLALAYPVAWPAAVGGLLFGIGAALNGGCAFSTVTHIGAGDLGKAFALPGLGLGFAVHDLWAASLLPASMPRPGPLAQPEPWSLALLAAVWVWAAREAVRLARPAAAGTRRSDRAFAAIALGSAALQILHGPWAYTAGLEQSAAWAIGAGPAPSTSIPLLFAGLFAGAVLAARRSGRARLRWPTRAAALGSLAGGVLMGAGAALVPGGNDALVLHALPGLLPHAALAYASLVAGAAATLLTVKAFRRMPGRGDPARPSRRMGRRPGAPGHANHAQRSSKPGRPAWHGGAAEAARAWRPVRCNRTLP